MAYDMTSYEFSTKIEWEGGIVAALEYGLKSTDLDVPDGDPLGDDLRRAWSQLETKWDAMKDDITAVSELLEQVDDRDSRGL